MLQLQSSQSVHSSDVCWVLRVYFTMFNWDTI